MFAWTALSLGYKFQWSDMYVAIAPRQPVGALLEYLTTWRLENGDGVTLPAIRVISDHISYAPLTCTQDVSSTFAAGSFDWVSHDLRWWFTSPGGQPPAPCWYPSTAASGRACRPGVLVTRPHPAPPLHLGMDDRGAAGGSSPGGEGMGL